MINTQSHRIAHWYQCCHSGIHTYVAVDVSLHIHIHTYVYVQHTHMYRHTVCIRVYLVFCPNPVFKFVNE